MKFGVVIPVGPGRHDNVRLALKYLVAGTELPHVIVLVCDGPDASISYESLELRPPVPHVVIAELPRRHEPGMEQPRNVGVRVLQSDPDLTHVWFLDSDIIVAPHALIGHKYALDETPEAISIGPYDWLPSGIRAPIEELRNDQRWPMFEERSVGPYVADLGVALGCFSGNLVWPISSFARVGGFHPKLHHGRCEDGELGLRAASHQIPMVLASSARGWHLDHLRDFNEIERRNTRDVPLINQWHPWVQDKGLILTEQDGARFDFQCECGERMNTLEMWQHFSFHHKAAQHNNDLILPDGL